MKFEKIKAGDTLYDVHSYRMGNTTMRSVGVWDVYVVSINQAEGYALAKWNGNPAQRWDRRRLEKLRAKKPRLVTTFAGGQRLARRDEKSEAR